MKARREEGEAPAPSRRGCGVKVFKSRNEEMMVGGHRGRGEPDCAGRFLSCARAFRAVREVVFA